MLFSVSIYHLVNRIKGQNGAHKDKTVRGGASRLAATLLLTIKRNVTRPWPPFDCRQLRNSSSGLYDLTLRPSVDATVDWQEGVYDEAYEKLVEAILPGSQPSESKLEKLVRQDESLRIDPEVHNFDLYPQAINLQLTVKAMRSGLPIKQAPAHNIELYATNLPAKVCDYSRKVQSSPYPLDLVVIIKTCVICFARRQVIRNTFANRHLWGDFKVSFVFVVGTLDRNAKTGYLPHEVRNANQQGAVESLFKDELESHKDILTGSFEDSYYKLHNKLVFSFRWASAFCAKSTPLFLFMDDDVTIIPRTLVPLIRRIPQRSQRFLIAGLFNRTYDVQRPTNIPYRWALSSTDYPYRMFAPYHWGFAYFVGAEMVTDAAIAMAFTKPIRVDDMYLGIVWKKLRYPLIGFKEFTYNGAPTDLNGTIAVGFTDNMMSKIDWTMTCLQEVARRKQQVCGIFRP